MLKLDKKLILEIQQRYSDLLNYAADDIFEPIDPLTYVNPEGDNLLHIAAMRGDEKTVEVLLNAGFDPNAKGDLGNTPLHYACDADNEAVVKLLMLRGANSGIPNELGNTPGL
jgi:ankyrin repeat protein